MLKEIYETRKSYTSEFKSQIVLEMLREDKTLNEIASAHGVHVNQLRQWKKAVVEQMPQLFSNENKKLEQMQTKYEEQVESLYAEVGKLTTQLSWLKKNLALRTREERLTMIDWEGAELSLKTQAELLSLNRSSLYYKPVGISLEDIALRHRIDEVYTKYPFYGSRRIAAHLQSQGLIVNRKAVQRHLREMGLAGIAPGPNLSKRNHQHRIYPYLLRHLVIDRPNHVVGH